MSQDLLNTLAQSLGNGNVKIVDLTHTLNESFPGLELPPEFGQVWPFKREQISQYNESGPGWYWNNFSCGEHTGTHFDAPKHWITGKDYPQSTVDEIDLKTFIAPVAVVDASAEVKANPDWLLTVEFLEAWEAKHGRIEQNNWVFLRSDWYPRISDPALFVNKDDQGTHTPGPTKEAVEWMINERQVLGFGVETINTDAGQSFGWEMPLPCHTLMHGANRYGLQCLKNLDQLPAKGAIIIAAPLKIENGSGSPLRVLALIS